jgi:hypothetical protein
MPPPPPRHSERRQVEIIWTDLVRLALWPNHIKFMSSAALLLMLTPSINESAERETIFISDRALSQLCDVISRKPRKTRIPLGNVSLPPKHTQESKQSWGRILGRHPDRVKEFSSLLFRVSSTAFPWDLYFLYAKCMAFGYWYSVGLFLLLSYCRAEEILQAQYCNRPTDC